MEPLPTEYRKEPRMNKIAFFLIATLPFCSGCNRDTSDSTGSSGIHVTEKAQSQSSTSHSSINTSDNWILFNSCSLKEKWQQTAFLTNDWNEFQQNADSYPAYSFEHPGSWKFNGFSVFDLPSVGKIAELAPGVIKLKPNQKCFEGVTPEEGMNFSSQPIQFGQLYGKKIISEFMVDGMPEEQINQAYQYCLSNGEFAFSISFVTDKPNQDAEKIFDKVVSTFRFSQVEANSQNCPTP